MTERDLYKYINSKRLIKRLEGDLNTLYSTMSNPRSPNLSLVPSDHSGDPSERLVFEIDEANRIKSKIEEARRECTIAALILDEVEKKLINEEERDVLDYIYRKGLTIAETSQKMRYSLSRVYVFRSTILKVASAIIA